MKRFLAPILLLTFLLPSNSLGGEVTMDDLVVTKGLHYKKFKDGPFTGEVTGEWFGTIMNGRKEGPWVRYWSKGELREKVSYKGGFVHGTYVAYHSNGQLWVKTTYKDHAMDGPFEKYYQNGQLFMKGTYNNGKRDGLWVSYHRNGVLASTGTIRGGLREGPSVGFNRDGTVWDMVTGTFKNGEKIK